MRDGVGPSGALLLGQEQIQRDWAEWTWRRASGGHLVLLGTLGAGKSTKEY